jgi:hypothetical protein
MYNKSMQSVETLQNKTRTACKSLSSKALADRGYDKKMLWRANLYIAETGGADWNDVHPWNAPADGVATVSTPKWWSVGWGVNEWNNPSLAYIGVAGGQVFSLPTTKWMYSFANHTEQITSNAVSYDHQGWDSPESFRTKLTDQAKLLNQWYTINGIAFKKPIYQWAKDTDVVNPDNMTIEGFKQYLNDEEIKGLDLAKLKTLYKDYRDNSDKRWAGNGDVLSSGSDVFFGNRKENLLYRDYIFPSKYGQNVAPYVPGTAGFIPDFLPGVQLNIPTNTQQSEAVMLNGQSVFPYVPGLSDSMIKNGDDEFKYPHAAIGKQTIGVDCIGFVQRAYTYTNSTYSAVKEADYRKGPLFWNSIDKDIPTSAMNRFHSLDYASKILDVNQWQDGSADPDVVIKVYDQFKYLVPGDVIWYSGQHIMLVQSIDAPSGPNGGYMIRDVHLIESVFNSHFGGFFGVVNDRTISQLLKPNDIDPRAWEIWRQR